MKPIYFHPATLDWLDSLSPWPPTAYDDFDQIARHNAKYEAVHGRPRPTTHPTTKPAP